MTRVERRKSAVTGTAAILLAAGVSRRMGGRNKLLCDVRGLPMVRIVAESLVEAGFLPVVAVLGRDVAAVQRALRDLPVRCVFNARYRSGMGASVVTGLEALAEDVQAVAIVPADMPGLRPELLEALRETFERSGRSLAAPYCRGRRGHPVFFRLDRFRRQLVTLQGDEGARRIVESAAADLLAIPVEDSAVLEDVDSPTDLLRWTEPEGTAE